MTDHREIERGIRHARAVFAPSAAQRDRVRTALAARAHAPAADPGASGRPVIEPAATRIRRKGMSRLLSLVKASALLGAGFALGYWFAESRDIERAPSALTAAALPADGRGPALRERDATLAAHPAHPALPHVEPAEPAPEPAPALGAEQKSGELPPNAPSMSSQPTSARSEARAASSAVATRATRRASPPRANVATSSLEELDWLRRAERAIRAGDGALARSFIVELETRYPGTTWREERDAIRVLAACTLREPDAERDARAFLQRRSTSVYLDRINDLCRLGADAPRDAAPVNGSHELGH